jgi:zinc/manganese transport system substrate-binding protein
MDYAVERTFASMENIVMAHRALRQSLGSLMLGLVIFSAVSTLAGCGTSASSSGGIRIVAAENFWGSIAAQVGGQHVSVTSLINEPNTDPHSYEPTTGNARDVVAASYVILNGAGYDPWADRLLKANPVTGRRVLNVGDLTGKKAGDNPHMWYSPDYVTAVATRIRDDLKALDPAHATDYERSAQTFLSTGLASFHQLITDIKTRYNGTPVGATESIFAYLAPALGLSLITPPSYLKAVSESGEVAAADEIIVEQQIKGHQIKVLIYNSQNTPGNIQSLIALAKANGIPVATITETMVPATAKFQDWQSSQLRGLEAALAQAVGH